MPTWLTSRSASRRFALAGGLVLLGLMVGGLAAFAYPMRIHGVTVGVPAALAGEGGVVVAAGVWNAARSAAALPVVGWVISVLVMATPRPEGDYLIAPTHAGYAYLLGGLILFTVLVALPYDRIAGTSPPWARPSRPVRPGTRK